MGPDDCLHNEGTYHDKKDYTFPDVQRCNLCDVVMNYSRKEYDDLEEGDFWYDEDDFGVYGNRIMYPSNF